MMVFAAVVDTNSFTKAADILRLTRARVSQIITRLETQLGVKLLVRTTRSLSLTEQGIGYYEKCNLIKDIATNANHEVSQATDNITGVIRIAAPVGIHFIASALAEFVRRYPLVQIELMENDGFSNFIETRADLAIRIGEMPDSTLIASKITEHQDVLCASKEYLAQFPEVKVPKDLLKMHWVSHLTVHGSKVLRLKNARNQITQYNHPAKISVSSIHSLKSFLLAHSGFGFIPSFCIEDEISSNLLVPLLQDYHQYSIPIYAVYPERQMIPNKTRVLLSFLKEQLNRKPNLKMIR